MLSCFACLHYASLEVAPVNRRTLMLLLLTASIALSLPIYVFADGNVEKAYCKITIKEGYVVMQVSYNISGNYPRLTYNISEYKDYIVRIYLIKGTEYSIVDTGDDIISVQYSIDTKLVFILKDVFKVEGSITKVDIPLSLIAPLEFNVSCDIDIIQDIASEWDIAYPPVFTKYTSTAHGVISCVSAAEKLRAEIILRSTEWLWLRCNVLNRTILIEDTGKVTVIDYMVLESIGNYRVSRVHLNLPANATIKCVRGVLGKYIRGGGIGQYEVSASENSTKLTVALVAPPAPGEIAELTIEYTIPAFSENGELIVNAFFNPNIMVLNSSVYIRVLGEIRDISMSPSERFVEGIYQVALFKDKIPSIPDLPVNTEVKINASINTFAKYFQYLKIGAVILIPSLLLFAYYKGFYSKRKIPTVVVEKIEYRSLVESLRNNYVKLFDLIERRKELRLRYLERKISRHVYRQRLLSISRKIAALEQDIGAKIKEMEEISPGFRHVADEIKRLMAEIKDCERELERIIEDRRRGRISRRDFERTLNEIEAERDKKMREISGILEEIL